MKTFYKYTEIINVDLKLCVFLKQLTSLEKYVGDATLKFEPFVLHVQCKKLEDAQLLVTVTLN